MQPTTISYPGYGIVTLHEVAPGEFEARVSSYKLWGAMQIHQDNGRALEMARARVHQIYDDLCPSSAKNFTIVGPDGEYLGLAR
jgi:hypothetical protein